MIASLMSNGADARAVNNVGDTPKDVACRLTSGLPKTRKLLISILDSSKYEVSGGIIFIVPGKPQPTRVEKEDAVENLPDPQAIVRADGVKFSPSRRNQRARTTKEIVKSRQPHTVEKKECFPARAVSKSIPTLPRGDHESAVGGTNHHLAAAFSSRRNMRRQASRYTRNGTDMRPAAADVRDTSGEDQQQPDIGVMFRDMRMVKNSSVLLNRGSKRRRLRAHCESRPITCSAGNSRGQLRDSDVARPTTTGHSTGISSPGIHDHVGSSESWSSRRQQARRRRHTPGGERGMKLAETSNARREKHDTVPDFEARRQISQWLRESAGNVVTVPATGGSRLGGHLTEKSGFVATDDRKEVYRALRTIKGEGRGELISSKRLRAMLCRTGQRLRPEEMNDLLREADPTDTGCVSFRLSTLCMLCV